MQFGRAFPCILQAIWETKPAQRSVWVSRLDVIDAYHCDTLRLPQVGTFEYVIPLAPRDNGSIILIDLVLLMGWVESPKILCIFSEKFTDVAKTLVDTELPVPSYGTINKIPTTRPPPKLTLKRASPISNVICMV